MQKRRKASLRGCPERKLAAEQFAGDRIPSEAVSISNLRARHHAHRGVPALAAVANAIYDGIGVRSTELRMSPPRLLEAILAKPVTAESQAAAD